MTDPTSGNFYPDLGVIVVSANSNTRFAIKNNLKELGVKNVFTSSRTSEASVEIERVQVDLVITEWNVEAMGAGMSLIEHMRKDKKLDKTGCIVLSARLESEFIANAVEFDVDEFLAMPFTLQSLRGAIESTVVKRKKPTLYSQLVTSAAQLITEKKETEAVELLNKALGSDSKPSMAHYWLGYIELSRAKADLAKAFDHFDKGLKCRALHLKCLFGKAFVYRREKKNEEYTETLKTILEVFPTHVNTLNQLIALYLEQKKTSEVFEKLKYLFSIQIDFPKVSNVIESHALAALKILDAAALKTSLPPLLPSYRVFCKKKKETYLELIKIMYDKGLDDFVGAEISKFREDHGDCFENEFLQVSILFRKNNYNHCIQACRDVIKKMGKSPDVLELVMKCYEKLGDAKRAEQAKAEWEIELKSKQNAASKPAG